MGPPTKSTVTFDGKKENIKPTFSDNFKIWKQWRACFGEKPLENIVFEDFSKNQETKREKKHQQMTPNIQLGRFHCRTCWRLPHKDGNVDEQRSFQVQQTPSRSWKMSTASLPRTRQDTPTEQGVLGMAMGQWSPTSTFKSNKRSWSAARCSVVNVATSARQSPARSRHAGIFTMHHRTTPARQRGTGRIEDSSWWCCWRGIWRDGLDSNRAVGRDSFVDPDSAMRWSSVFSIIRRSDAKRLDMGNCVTTCNNYPSRGLAWPVEHWYQVCLLPCQNSPSSTNAKWNNGSAPDNDGVASLFNGPDVVMACPTKDRSITVNQLVQIRDIVIVCVGFLIVRCSLDCLETGCGWFLWCLYNLTYGPSTEPVDGVLWYARSTVPIGVVAVFTRVSTIHFGALLPAVVVCVRTCQPWQWREVATISRLFAFNVSQERTNKSFTYHARILFGQVGGLEMGIAGPLEHGKHYYSTAAENACFVKWRDGCMRNSG